MTLCECRREKGSYIFTWPEYTITVKDIREDSFGLKCALWVAQTVPAPGTRGLITWGELRPAKQEERVKFAKTLKERVNTADWPKMVDYATTLAVEGFLTGEPVIDLRDGPLPGARPYLMPRLLPEGETSMLYADGGGAKSLTALTICAALKTGSILPNGLRPLKQTASLYLDWETSEVAHKRRLWRLARGMGLAERPSIKYMRMERPLIHEIDLVEKRVLENNIGLIVVDSLGAAAGKELKDTDAATSQLTALRGLRVTVLVIHHMTKVDASSDKLGTPFGTAYFRNLSRNVWELRSSPLGDHSLRLAFWHRKDNDGRLEKRPLGFLLNFVDPDGSISWAPSEVEDDPEMAKHGGLTFVVRALLKAGAMTTTELAEETGATADSLRVTLRRMPDVIQVEQGAQGKGKTTKWGLAEKTEHVPF